MVERVSLPTKRLDDIEDLPQFDLLKIDVQGGECLVFRNGPEKLSRALAVITEVAALPIYRDQPLLHDQLAALAVHGFHLHKFLFFKDDRFSQRPDPEAEARPLPVATQRRGRGSGARSEQICHVLRTKSSSTSPSSPTRCCLTQDLAVTAMAELARRNVIALDGIHVYIDRLPASAPAA